MVDMKKFGFILGLVTYVSLTCAFQVSAQQNAPSTDESATRTQDGKRVYNVGILFDEFAVDIAPLFSALKSEIVAVVGEDATIRFPDEMFLPNEFDRVRAESNYQTLVRGDTDIIIAFGRTNSEVISVQSSFPKPTILFGAVNRDVIKIDLDADTSGVHNFTYLVTSQSYEKDLTTLKGLFDFQRVGVIVDGPASVVESVRSVVHSVAEDLDVSYSIIPYDSPAAVSSQIAELDAVYIAEGFLIPNEEIVELATIFVEAGVPSFTATTREDVVTGLMATNQADENLGQFFRRIALGVEAAINGENLSSRPIFINGNERLSINYATARRVNVPLRYSTLSTTDIVGDFDDFHADRTYTLLEIIEEALANNLSLAAARKTVALAEQDVKSARSNYLPSVSVSATGSYVDPVLAELSGGQNPEYSTFGNVNLSQTLYSEAANANISIQKYRLKAGREELNADEMDLVLNVSNAYFNVLILKSNARIRKQNLELTKRNLAIAEEHFEAGQSGRVDILRFRSELAQNTQAQVDAIDGLQRGFFALNQLLNNPIDKNINVADAREAEGIFKGYQHGVLETFLDDPIIRQSFVRFLSEQAAANAPELRSLDYSIEATQRSVTLNGLRRFMPTVGASANYNRTFDQWGTGSLPSESILSDNYNVGVSVSIPLFDRNRESISRQTAIIQKQQLQLNRDNVALSIDANVRNAVSDLTTQISNIELSRVSEETAGESLELSQASYSSGAITLVQLLDAQNNYLQAQLSRATANYNYLISAIILERYIGYYFLQHTETQNEEFRQRFFDYQQRSEESK